MLWEPGKPLIWTLKIRDFPLIRHQRGEVGGRGSVCGDYRKQGEGGVMGNDMREGIQDTEASVSFGKKSKEGTNFTEVRGGKNFDCSQYLYPDQPPLLASLKWFSLPL